MSSRALSSHVAADGAHNCAKLWQEGRMEMRQRWLWLMVLRFTPVDMEIWTSKPSRVPGRLRADKISILLRARGQFVRCFKQVKVRVLFTYEENISKKQKLRWRLTWIKLIFNLLLWCHLHYTNNYYKKNKKNSPKNFCGVDLLRLVMLIASLSTCWILSLDGLAGLVIFSIFSSPADGDLCVIIMLTITRLKIFLLYYSMNWHYQCRGQKIIVWWSFVFVGYVTLCCLYVDCCLVVQTLQIIMATL